MIRHHTEVHDLVGHNFIPDHVSALNLYIGPRHVDKKTKPDGRRDFAGMFSGVSCTTRRDVSFVHVLLMWPEFMVVEIEVANLNHR